MKRTIIKIDEDLCNGCGMCVNGCHEGALQLIDGKAVMVSELYCDGLGACIGDCPMGAIQLEEREAEAYDEAAVLERLLPKGEEVLKAHLKHLQDHDQLDLLDQAAAFLKNKGMAMPIAYAAADQVEMKKVVAPEQHQGCPGSRMQFFATPAAQAGACVSGGSASALQQWPVQLHLLSPVAPFLAGADVLLAADCCAFAVGDFHSRFLQNRRLAIACPKLDSNKEAYVEKLQMMIDEAKINTLTVVIMEVPCCGGLLQLVNKARERARRHIPVRQVVVSLRGEVLSDEWK